MNLSESEESEDLLGLGSDGVDTLDSDDQKDAWLGWHVDGPVGFGLITLAGSPQSITSLAF